MDTVIKLTNKAWVQSIPYFPKNGSAELTLYIIDSESAKNAGRFLLPNNGVYGKDRCEIWTSHCQALKIWQVFLFYRLFCKTMNTEPYLPVRIF